MTTRLNDEDRRQWVENDEGLYLWCRDWMSQTKRSKRQFIREHRDELDACILAVIDGTKKPHFLVYG